MKRRTRRLRADGRIPPVWQGRMAADGPPALLGHPGRPVCRRRSLLWEVHAVETTKQITVFLENKPGRLANVLSALAHEKVNITALSVMDKHEHSVLRLVTDDAAKTAQIIQGINTPFTEAEVLAVELRNQPGALAHVCEILAGEHINIDYAYCSSGG